MSDILRVADAIADDRFSRFELIGWWEQERLAAAKVLLLGAGALGNEILKNLALLGVGRVYVADLDTVENSNLSRSVLFREQDCGRPKAEVVAERARDVYPEMQIGWARANIVYDLGLGIYRWADVILGGLDNREARVAINQAAAKCSKPWIDGAIERLDGVARVFDPATGPCYECTMNETDWKMLRARRSCALLNRDQMLDGKVPTTPTTASVIAGIQCQEAVKLIHGMEILSGRGFVFEGMSHQSYVVSYSRKADCLSHEAYESIIPIDRSVQSTRIGDFLEFARGELGGNAVIDLNSDLLESLECPACREVEQRLCSLGKVTERDALCRSCGEPRIPKMFHTIDGRESFLDRSFAEIGVPPWDILTARVGLRQRHYEFVADRRQVLGVLDR
ncbi:MAG TPA: ThiF family adenylyltransferase [Planctomycetaceae bacterium]|nr:ThiF family adenylyltransferase [Planctomycetaceae bacterium]